MTIALQAKGLTKEFKGFIAVNNVGLSVKKGTIHALIGPNGAGKTTCFNLLTKFLQPTRGQITYEGRDITVQDMFEAVGRYQAGEMTDEELAIMERVACPSAGACGGQFTANTMACVSEAIGLALFNSSGMPAPYESRGEYGVASGEAVMNLLEKNIRARDVVTLKSLQNAARVVACKPRAAAPAAPKGKGDKKKGASHEPQQVYRVASSVCGSSMRFGNMHVSMCGHERMHVCMPAIAGAIAGLCARVSLGVRACVCTH